MWRYLRAAFMVGIHVRGLGRLPLNAMAAFGVGVLGFVEPSVWLAGLGVEAALVSALAFNPRFQNVIDARTNAPLLEDEASKRGKLVAALPQELQARLARLQQTSARVLGIYERLGVDRQLTSGTEASLDKFQWIFLKLLVARHHLVNELGLESQASLESRIEQMQQQSSVTGPLTNQLAAASSTPSSTAAAAPSAALARSQEATIAILRRRVENLKNRDQLIRENESDLCRIEAQVELMRENAAIEGKPTAVDTEIEFASDLASPDLFGIHTGLVRDLEAVRPR